eukprot:GHVT01019480.1.p1 GENE.GHVT01019480.1~~GHVT01019480.1.p1  ORF type:complete len:211 (+),score=3.34 GHVT01019480.1:217-849(+)
MPPKKQPPRRAARNMTQPPALRGNLEGRHTFRFKQVYSGSETVKLYADDLAFLMGVGTSGNVMQTLWESVLIRSISIWTPVRQISGTLQDPRATSITWLGEYTPRSEVFATTSQQSGVAYIHMRPPKNSGSGKWQKIGQGTLGEPLVQLVVPDQSIVDITVSYVFDDDQTVSPISLPGFSGLAIGTLYYGAADSYYGTKVLTPMGLTAPT